VHAAGIPAMMRDCRDDHSALAYTRDARNH